MQPDKVVFIALATSHQKNEDELVYNLEKAWSVFLLLGGL